MAMCCAVIPSRPYEAAAAASKLQAPVAVPCLVTASAIVLRVMCAAQAIELRKRYVAAYVQCLQEGHMGGDKAIEAMDAQLSEHTIVLFRKLAHAKVGPCCARPNACMMPPACLSSHLPNSNPSDGLDVCSSYMYGLQMINTKFCPLWCSNGERKASSVLRHQACRLCIG